MAELAPLVLDGIMDYLVGRGAPPAIPGFFLDLYDGDPLTTGSSVLATLTGSATRVDQESVMSDSEDGVITNESEIEITDAVVGGANVQYVAFFDAATGGDLTCTSLLSIPQTVTAGVPLVIPAGDLVLTLVA